ncbi:MAG: thiamine phosphate synthase, partial [Kordiimonadaceae bacterium]|nr:thiamine phosphate synthase [Kordiimonadaceae bacterium]
MSETRLYLITPNQFDLDEFSISLKEALDGGDVA